MKGNEKLLLVLNSLLADKLTSIKQHSVNSVACENWGYLKLYLVLRKQTMDEAIHARWLIERIVLLNGTPPISRLHKIKISSSVLEMIGNTNIAGLEALRACKDAISLASEVNDQETIGLLLKILEMEESRVDLAEIQCAHLEKMDM